MSKLIITSSLSLNAITLALFIASASVGGRASAQSSPQNHSHFSTLLHDIGTALGSLRTWLGGNPGTSAVWIGSPRPLTVSSDSMQFTSTKLVFDTIQDTSGFISPWSPPGTISIPENGFYTISINIAFNENNSRGGRGVRLWQGSKILGTVTSPPVPNTHLSLTTTHYFHAGDTITAYVSQSSGQSVPLISGNGAGFFSITKI